MSGFSHSMDLLDQDVHDRINKAERGDRKAALQILEIFSERIENGLIPDFRYMKYLANCFALILNDIPPNKALSLDKPAHRTETTKERNMRYAVEVKYQILQSGLNASDAIRRVTQTHFDGSDISNSETGHETIRSAYYKYKKIADFYFTIIPPERYVKK